MDMTWRDDHASVLQGGIVEQCTATAAMMLYARCGLA
jgi:hypothetical protein